MDTVRTPWVRSMSADVRTYTARWVFPACFPPLEGGTVSIRGEKIEAVEPHGVRTADEDLGNVALIPGLVNAHTHLDLSGAKGLIPPTDPDHFTDWLKGVIAYRRMRSEEQTRADIETGLAECLRYGTTLIGDIANEGKSWDALSRAKTRAVVFWELIGLSLERTTLALVTLNTLVNRLTDLTAKGGSEQTTRLSLSPHAPYSVSRRLLDEVYRTAREHRLPMSTHLAETQHEVDLLAHHRGPFATFLRDLGVWHPDQLTSGWDDWLNRRKRRAPDLYIHANYLTPTSRLPTNASVVYCPRTHAAFGHPPHPFREFLACGVRVCFGTDSLASNPDLDILAEARFVHAKYPDFPGEQLLKMVTLNGAEALGWADECGSLEAGKSADMVAVSLPDPDGDPHELLFGPGIAGESRRTMWRGEWR